MTAVKELEELTKTEAEKPKKREAGVRSVVKIIEVLGTSTIGFDDAIETAIKTASHSLRHITGADVKHMTIGLKDGRITEYRVDLKLAFALEPEDDEEDH